MWTDFSVFLSGGFFLEWERVATDTRLRHSKPTIKKRVKTLEEILDQRLQLQCDMYYRFFQRLVTDFRYIN